jgi:hypothetical protein
LSLQQIQKQFPRFYVGKTIEIESIAGRLDWKDISAGRANQSRLKRRHRDRIGHKTSHCANWLAVSVSFPYLQHLQLSKPQVSLVIIHPFDLAAVLAPTLAGLKPLLTSSNCSIHVCGPNLATFFPRFPTLECEPRNSSIILSKSKRMGCEAEEEME